MHLVFEREELHNFKHCPYCGHDDIRIHECDTYGYIYCNASNCSYKFYFDDLEETADKYHSITAEILERDHCEVCKEHEYDCTCHDCWGCGHHIEDCVCDEEDDDCLECGYDMEDCTCNEEEDDEDECQRV